MNSFQSNDHNGKLFFCFPRQIGSVKGQIKLEVSKLVNMNNCLMMF